MQFMPAILLVAASLSGPLLGPPPGAGGTPAERIGAAAIQAALSYVLETKVTVEGLKLDQAAGTMTLTGLHVANPKDFADGDAVILKSVVVEAEPGALTAKEPEIHRIAVEGATVHATHDLKHGLNIQRLQKSAERLQRQTKPLVALAQPEPTLLKIGTAVLDNCEIVLNSPLLGGSRAVPLQKLEIDYAKENDGKPLTADKAVAIAVDRVMREVMARVGDQSPLAGLLTAPK